jgi:trk system potassium uptake protein
MSLQSIREKINLKIQPSKERNLHYLRYVSFFISVITIITLIVYYGFEWKKYEKDILVSVVKFSFGFYIINFLIKLFYSFSPRKFIERNWLEGLLMTLLTIDATSKVFLGSSLTRIILVSSDAPDLTPFYVGFIQFYLLIIVLIELSKATRKLKSLNISPPTIMLLSFLLLILSGAILLTLPRMTVNSGSMNFLDALFTAASAGCVTGLSVVDTYQFFTFKGQLIILFLMKIGGLSIIAFATFFASMMGSSMGLKHTNIMKSFLSTESLVDAKNLLRRIIKIGLLVEFLGVIFLFFSWPKEIIFKSFGEKLFFSIFHSVSAFNSAGFSLFPNGFDDNVFRNAYILKIALMLLMYVGALGIAPLIDYLHPKNIRERRNSRWKKPLLSSRIAIISSAVLTLITFFLFFVLESNNTLQHSSNFTAVFDSLFQAISPRSCGFNTVNIGNLTSPTIIILILMMFIGGNSGSTAGGIKTSSFTLMILSAASTISGKKNIELARQSISFELINKAFSIFLFMSGFIFTGVFILSITDAHVPMVNLVFEMVSAVGNVGLSTGITAKMSGAGKVILIIGMFVGRVGILTLAFALSKKVISSNYKYPKTHIMIG